jgi:A/G-specific adenine glycosylase
MLQQTQVARVGPIWQAFMTRFPTVEALAAASPAEVLRAWRGLGYNRRAVNLHRAARVIMDEHSGRPPVRIEALERLPGVGRYTARAVAAIAFGAAVGPVDTNVRRVLGRVAVGDPAHLKPADMQRLADAIVPADRPGSWTHALMDIGSTLCKPARPSCGQCPVRAWCRFVAESRPGESAPISRRPRPGASKRTAGPAATPFERTSRWLRGRIVDRLRAAEGEAWIRFGDPIGDHDPAAVLEALARLAADGLLELAPGDPIAARLPSGAR